MEYVIEAGLGLLSIGIYLGVPALVVSVSAAAFISWDERRRETRSNRALRLG